MYPSRMGTVRALREVAVDLRSVASSIGVVASRARATFQRPLLPNAGAVCTVPGCSAPATWPCICSPELCDRHYAEEVGL